MVAACFFLSGVTCYYGLIRKSRMFVGIGLIGGLTSAWMPSSQNLIATSALLEAMVVLAALPDPGLEQMARSEIVVVWPIAFLAASRFLGSDFPWAWRVAYIDGLSLAFALAYAYAFEENPLDPQMAFPPVALICAAAGSWLIRSGVDGSLHALLFAAAIIGSGMAFYRSPRKVFSLQITGSAIAAFLVPFGLSTEQALGFFGTTAILLCAISLWRRQPVLLGFAAIEIGGGIYSLLALETPNAGTVIGGGCLLLVAMAATVALFKILLDKLEEAVGLAGLAGLGRGFPAWRMDPGCRLAPLPGSR